MNGKWLRVGNIPWEAYDAFWRSKPQDVAGCDIPTHHNGHFAEIEIGFVFAGAYIE